jgi:SpoIID/LytB domain protein
MVRLSIVSALALACLAPAPASASWLGGLSVAKPRRAAASASVFVVSGHGWGHGVGLSQYGALGYAQHGWTFAKILAHYFPGTAIGPAPVAKVRVLLAGGRSSVTIASPVAFRVRDGAGDVHDLAAGTVQLGPGLKLTLADQPKKKALPAPLTFLPGGQPLQLGRRYRGSLQVDVVGGRLRVINVVGLEPYLYGVVPSEMPHVWQAEALKAQAVVARSYALAVRKTGPFDLYPDQRSQVYLGVDHEFPESTAAVEATAGQVVLYDGEVARTYFFSTSGGRTASSEDIWGGAVPYLVPVADPYDSISPYHNWGPYGYSGSKLARGLHVPGPVTDARTTVNASGRAATLTVTTPQGERAIPAASVRKLLGLRSTWFTVGALALDPPPGPVVYGSAVKLTGTARGLRRVELQARVAPGGWRRIARARPGRDGALALRARPLAPTDYRLATASFAAGRVHVRVAPLVKFDPDFRPDALAGVVKPALAGASVAIQRLDGTAWRTVTRTRVDADGAFTVALNLVSGTYRARASVGHGFAPGATAPLKVTAP